MRPFQHVSESPLRVSWLRSRSVSPASPSTARPAQWGPVRPATSQIQTSETLTLTTDKAMKNFALKPQAMAVAIASALAFPGSVLKLQRREALSCPSGPSLCRLARLAAWPCSAVIGMIMIIRHTGWQLHSEYCTCNFTAARCSAPLH